MDDNPPEYVLRVAGDEYMLYYGSVGATHKGPPRSGLLEDAPPWLQVIVATAVLRGEKEPYFVTLDKNLHMLTFLDIESF